MRSFFRLALLWSCALAPMLTLPEQGFAQSASDRQYSSEDIEAGSRVYAADCSLCHGASGDGVDRTRSASEPFSGRAERRARDRSPADR